MHLRSYTCTINLHLRHLGHVHAFPAELGIAKGADLPHEGRLGKGKTTGGEVHILIKGEAAAPNELDSSAEGVNGVESSIVSSNEALAFFWPTVVHQNPKTSAADTQNDPPVVGQKPKQSLAAHKKRPI
jgi:hypothetical protein